MYNVSKTTHNSIRALLIILILILSTCMICSCGHDKSTEDRTSTETEAEAVVQIDENGEFTTAEDVAEYIHTYHKLPPNYMSEQEAKDLGWRTYECPADYDIMIGGRHFGNYEGLLPEGERYYECDVDYDGHARGKRRLVYTEDGAVYYTGDHYNSFEQLYQED